MKGSFLHPVAAKLELPLFIDLIARLRVVVAAYLVSDGLVVLKSFRQPLT